jgi:hypothetical protein
MELEEIVRLTLKSLLEREILETTPNLAVIISDVQEMYSANLEEENDGQPDWEQEWYDFDPDC